MTSHVWTVRRAVMSSATGELAFFLQRRLTGGQRRLRRFTEKDFFLLVQQLTLGLGAAALPQSWWPRLCLITSLRRRTIRRQRAMGLFSAKVRDVLGPFDDPEVAALYNAVQARLDQRQMTYLRERFSCQTMTTHVQGVEHLDASLAKGVGAILWNSPALGDTIVTKRALSAAGCPAHQLSVRSHGFSQSRFAVRHLNPAQIAVEDRYLAGRIWFNGNDVVRATREVMRLLQRNKPVIFSNSQFAGHSFVAVPVGARFHLPLATTPLSIAANMGVPLHVLTTIEVAPFTRYLTQISPALTIREGIRAADTDTRIVDLALQARDILLDFGRRYPDQIRLWDPLIDPDDVAPQSRAE